MNIELDRIYNMDCLEGMKQIPDGTIDLTVTSPPYDNLRSYGGIGDDWNFDKFKAIATELVRITKPGGVIVWVVADATIDGSETGTSFKQALHFKELGMNLHDTMIWEKKSYVPLSNNRYEQCFEFMFVLSKGTPKTFNPLKSKCETAGVPHRRTKSNKEEGSAFRNRDAYTVCNEYKIRKNIFEYDHPNVHFDHPAIFPLILAREHIYSWSNEQDVVLDPFMGSGTTAIACIKEHRHFIGFELNKEYFDKACKRIDNEQRQLTLF